jgi:dienelactone hydrolase
MELRLICDDQKEGTMIRNRATHLKGLLAVCTASLILLQGCEKKEEKRIDPRVVQEILPPSTSSSPSTVSRAAPVFPDRTPAKALGLGVMLHQMRIMGTGPGLPMMVNLYLPYGQHPAKSLPCILIAPAGTAFHGGEIEESDRPEHIPYVRKGFAVLAYELSGAMTGPRTQKLRLTYGDVRPSVQAFMAADGGLANGKIALDYIEAKVPEIDPNQLYACGHSSSADVALNLAAGDKRIRAVCAYAPRTDVEAWWADPKMEKVIPGFKAFATRKSPLRHAGDINCPVFLFHADDDSMVPLADNQAFADAMKAANKKVVFKTVPRGDHYDSMIKQGIPDGIEFLMFQGAKPVPPKIK